jgi:polysaccharide biosynthesis transport protein
MAAYSAAAPTRGDGDIDLGAVARALWTHRMWILVPTLAVFFLSFIAVQIITPRFKSEARVLFEGRENVFLRPEAEKTNPSTAAGDPEATASQVQVAMSREVAIDVIRNLKLTERPEFDPALGGVSSLKYLMIALGLARDPLRLSPEERALEVYFERISVFAVERSRVIVIEFQSPDAELAARIANAIADAYIARQRAAKQDQSRGASQWLVGEIDKLRARVSEAEGRVESFRAKANLFVGTNSTTLSNQQLGELNAQLTAARAQKADAETRARSIRELLRKGEGVEASDVLNSEIIRRLTEQRATFRTQLAEQSSTLLDAHPRIKELKAQIGDADRQIRNEAEKLVRTFENDARQASARVDTLNASLDGLKSQAGRINEQDIQLRALDREAKAQRELLEAYLAKYREATARETIGSAPTADARVISRANMSNTPHFPKKIPTVLVATLAALMLSAGFIVTGEIMRASSGAPRAVAVEEAPVEPVRPVSHPAVGVPVSAITDISRRLADTAHLGRRVAVFSASSAAATSLAALTLARALSRESRVVLVDLAPGNPNLAAISSDPQAPGVSDVIRGASTFSDIITKDKLSRLHLVGAGTGAGDIGTVLALPEFTAAAEALARSYDFFIIDASTAPDSLIGRIAGVTPRAVLIAPQGTDRGMQAAYDHFMAAGFTDVSVATGASPPPSSPTPVRAVAAA